MPIGDRSPRRLAKWALALAALVCASGQARADNILRHARPPGGASSASADATAAAAAAAQADAAARQAQSPLRQALDAIRQFQAAQSAARAAAQAAPGSVPNGLGPGGLELAPDGYLFGAGAPTQTTQAGRSEVTVTQTAPRAVLTWDSFNVGSLTDVHFDQTAGGSAAPSWVLLNRVIDPNAAPSQILGSIKAEGQVYLINRSGILFGGGSQVNVGSLVVSGLDLAGSTLDQRNQRFLSGTLYDLSFNGQAGPVTVEEGAQIGVSNHGRALLLGGQVFNAGAIDAPDGQVMLAAGSSIALQAPGDLSAVRGYPPPLVSADGIAENNGIISTPRGNITMVAAQTLQDGILTATTGAQANGSITLGQDGLRTTLGERSVTQILPDGGPTKVIGSGADFVPSRIDLFGDQIRLLDGASIYAPSGRVSLSAVMTADPTGAGIDDTRVYLGRGARIDVSGLLGVEAPMEQNSIQAQLRANELRDDPLLRNVPGLRGRTVWFDGRLGVPAGVADLSGYYALLERDVRQLMTAGGTVDLLANQIIARQGSTIDLSGGSLRYRDGYVRSSLLVDATGRRVPIEETVRGVPYLGIDGDFVVSHSRWGAVETFGSIFTGARPHFEPGYEQGSSAGTLALGTNVPLWFDLTDPTNPPKPSATGAVRVFDGDILASTVTGPRQRQLPTGSTDPTQTWRQQPQGAVLAIQNAGDVTIGAVGPLLGASFHADDAVDPSLLDKNLLPARWFNGSTFKVVGITSGSDPDGTPNTNPSDARVDRAPGGHLTIPEGVVVDLGDGGSFSFRGRGAEIDGTLLAPGGKVSLTTLQTSGADTPTIHLSDTGAIDVAGRFTNDHLDGATAPMRALNGGSVSLTGNAIVLDPGSLVDASGGGALNSAGSKLTYGNGGSIGFDVSRWPFPIADQTSAYQGTLSLGGDLRGYALGLGGSLSLSTGNDVVIGGALPAGAGASVRLITPDFFTQGGFSSWSINGAKSLTVLSGTQLAPSTQSLVAAGTLEQLRTGARLDGTGNDAGLARQVLPEDARNPMKLTLSTSGASTNTAAYSRELDVQAGATIRMEPGSTVTLSSNQELRVDGTIETPGGTIQLNAKSPQLDPTLLSIVELGDQARLLAGGFQKTTVAGAVTTRSVQPGGAISVNATNVAIAPGAVLDVSGIAGVADEASPTAGPIGGARTQPMPVDGDAGAVSINAGAGLVAGSFRLQAGGPSGLGGSLAIGKNGGGLVGPIIVRQDAPAGPAGSATTLTVVADSIDASGAGDLSLQETAPVTTTFSNANAILFDGSVDLHTTRSITLLSPVLGTVAGSGPSTVTLSSSYVQLHGATGNPAAAGALGLQSDLTVRADLIDMTNTVLLGCVADPATCRSGGFGAAHFVSSGDIRLSDHDAAGNTTPNPGLLSSGALYFDSAQVYVTSRDQGGAAAGLERAPGDPGFLVESGQSITISSNGALAPVPLSFGERLTLRAPTITQGGVLRAPAGQLRLEGAGPNGSVTLLPGSLTSSSLEGEIVPFGAVQAGGVFFGYDQAGAAPTKSITLSAPAVAVQKGAVVDVSGGGDLLGYTFVPGNGGSTDILGAAKGFAVLPASPFFCTTPSACAPAPVGPTSALRDPTLKVGDEVYLQDLPGLAPGYYTLLPAHYALLPGGLLVQPLGGSLASPAAALLRPDGAEVVSGYLTDGGAPGYRQFAVMPGDVFGRYSDLVSYSFDQRAVQEAAQAGLSVRTPFDAGSVVLNASDSLLLRGAGRFGAPKGGLLGNLDISAPEIAVIGAGAAAPDPSKGYLVLDPQALTDFGAGSVLLGGTRSASTDPSQPTGTSVAVNANDVYVATGAESWTGPEIILAAKGSVTVADGSVIRAQGTSGQDTSPLLFGGDGALLRLSSSGRVALVRSGATGSAGTLIVGDAELTAADSLSLDGSLGVSLAPAARISARQFDLASVRVNLGDAPPDAPGVTLGEGRLAALAAASDLLIRGYDSIDLYGALALGDRDATGAATLKAITLDTGLLQGHADPGVSARLTAGDLTLRNSGGGGTAGASGLSGLLLDVDMLHLGPGTMQIAGYASLQGSAGSIVAAGSGGLSFAGDVTLATSAIEAASGASYAMNIGGAASFTSEASAAPSPPSSLGGSVAITASSLLLDTAVALPAGSFAATATAGGVRLGSHASVDVSGVAVPFEDQLRFAPGGAIQLTAAQDLRIDSGASLDVSGSTSGGSAGLIELTAGGNAIVLGNLRGAGAAGFTGGSFSLDAGTLGAGAAAFPALNASLAASGFDSSLRYRLRSQDLLLPAGDRIVAHEVLLRSDTGSVTVAGEIDAEGTAFSPGGGDIEISGGNGVSLTGTLDAQAFAGPLPADAFSPASGKVTIAATGGRVDLAPSSVIDVSGGGGAVEVRAPRDGNDVAVDRLAADLRGARELDVIGVADYQAAVVDAALADTLISQASAWLSASQGAIALRLGGANAGLLQVGPGMVVTSAGDLSIQSDLDLSRITGAPGYLGFAAAGNLDIKATNSDGFAGTARGAALLGGRSFAYAFESGGDLTLEPNAMIRTGAGDISLRAGRDLDFVTPQAATDAAAVVYTAGQSAATPGFLGAAIGAFPTGGGDIDLQAGRDILSPLPSQTTSAWLFRSGDTSWAGAAGASPIARQTSWSVVFANFEQGVGALGGGEVQVRAGRDIVQLQISIPTTGFLSTPPGSVATPADLTVRGGGDLELWAARDIRGGLFMLGEGHADLRAGGSVTPGDEPVSLRTSPASSALGTPRPLGALFGLMDASAAITAVSEVVIEGAFDPMREGQIAANLVNGAGSGFWSYTDRSALDATSLSGSVRYRNDPWAAADLSLANTTPAAFAVRMSGVGFDAQNDMFSRAPPTLRLTALEGSVYLEDPFGHNSTLSLAPAARGTLELLAAGDVHLAVGTVKLDDVGRDFLHGPLDPFSVSGGLADVGHSPDATNNFQRGFTPLHAGDPDPVRIYALGGSVCALRSGSCTPDVRSLSTQVVAPKPIEVIAGKDVLDGIWQPQNDGPGDISLLKAGRDLYEPDFEIAGPGAALLQAGRDVVLDQYGAKSRKGGAIDSLGNRNDAFAQQINQALPAGKGADIYLLAGAANKVDYDAFAAAYLDPANARGLPRTYLPELAVYLQGLGYAGSDPLTAFQALPLARREIFLDQIYFSELKLAGIDYNDAQGPRYHSYGRGFTAVSLLFPTDPSSLTDTQRGDVILNARSLETQANGDITVLAPYGRVSVGADILPAGVDPSSGGIVTRRGGDVRVMANDNIDLFTSRVFTLEGGDVTMWTSNGSITAGAGAQTSVFQRPLAYTMDNEGVIAIDAFGLQTGAGIGVLDALLNSGQRKRSRLDLIAPRGEVNAGDAGIRVVGDLNIAAAVVVGVENISASGAVAGVPKVEAPNLGALTGASQTAQATAREAVAATAQAKNTVVDLPSIVTVEVVGYEKTDDADERRKKKDPAPR